MLDSFIILLLILLLYGIRHNWRLLLACADVSWMSVDVFLLIMRGLRKRKLLLNYVTGRFVTVLVYLWGVLFLLPIHSYLSIHLLCQFFTLFVLLFQRLLEVGYLQPFFSYNMLVTLKIFFLHIPGHSQTFLFWVHHHQVRTVLIIVANIILIINIAEIIDIFFHLLLNYEITTLTIVLYLSFTFHQWLRYPLFACWTSYNNLLSICWLSPLSTCSFLFLFVFAYFLKWAWH